MNRCIYTPKNMVFFSDALFYKRFNLNQEAKKMHFFSKTGTCFPFKISPGGFLWYYSLCQNQTAS